MCLTKLFQMQNVLDNEINDRFPNLQERDNLDCKILTLLSQLGDLGNVWRGFKKWGNNKVCEAEQSDRNPLLEEYTYCLSLILSLGNKINAAEFNYSIPALAETSIDRQIITVIREVTDFHQNMRINAKGTLAQQAYKCLFMQFINLSGLFGFDWGEIEKAHHEKTKIMTG